MTNRELSDAIHVANETARSTATTEQSYLLWIEHLKALLEIQRNRATEQETACTEAATK